jgi:hypothetical protein
MTQAAKRGFPTTQQDDQRSEPSQVLFTMQLQLAESWLYIKQVSLCVLQSHPLHSLHD